ncbi:MAG: hypothetical protein Q4A05_05475 [Ruminococcus sp.]|nr:hypothetical protein [Ruminococcus sp.]
MDNFLSLSEDAKGGLLLWLLFAGFTLFLALIIHIFTDRSLRRLLICAAETLFTFTFYQILIDQIRAFTSLFIGIPAVTVVLIAALLTAVAVAELIGCLRKRNSRLTMMSVKESMDSLPTGICFYWDGGLTKLVNLTMDSIANQLTGENISDAEHFCKTVFGGETPYSVKGGEMPVICFADGTAYSFAHREEMLDGKPIHELIAYNITEEFRLTAELREKQKQARYINARLKALNSTIQYLIMDKETLRIKINIHDSFGKTLLMTKRYLSAPESVDRAEMLSLWRMNIAMLKNEQGERWQQPYFISLHHAEGLGVKIKITGTLPENAALVPVVDSAITVHVTNVLRHAEGDTAYISARKTAEGYALRFTNNGRAPAKPVQETGGLANLRRRTEGIGGAMKIRSAPQFELLLWLPETPKEEL